MVLKDNDGKYQKGREALPNFHSELSDRNAEKALD